MRWKPSFEIGEHPLEHHDLELGAGGSFGEHCPARLADQDGQASGEETPRFVAAPHGRMMVDAETGRVMNGQSSGARLRGLLDEVGLSPHWFAAYWAGYPLGQPVPRDERTERGRRFRSYRRSLFRWLRDEQTPGDDVAFEIVAVANRLLVEEGREPLAAAMLVTPRESRLASLERIEAKLDDVLGRLAALEERGR